MASIKRIGKDNLGVPVWEAVYRRTSGGKQVRRRFHASTKADVQRQILLDSARSGIELRWSEGESMYLSAKRGSITDGSAYNVSLAVRTFISLMGDISIEDTTPEVFRSFMSQCTTQKVANHHRRALLSVANYLKNHSGKIVMVPFGSVPPFPTKPKPREPIPEDRIEDYLGALPPHVRRPAMMILVFGLRSTAVCKLSVDSRDGRYLRAWDKGGVRRLIPVDGILGDILSAAAEWREETGAPSEPSSALFVCEKGRPWTHDRLLRHAQKYWKSAGLGRKVMHEIRHTLGTLAGRSFPARMVQAALGHRSEQSSLAYWHPDETLAAEVRNEIITKLSQSGMQQGDSGTQRVTVSADKTGRFTCPHCHATLYISNRKTTSH